MIRCFLEESIREEDWNQIVKVVQPSMPSTESFERDELIV